LMRKLSVVVTRRNRVKKLTVVVVAAGPRSGSPARRSSKTSLSKKGTNKACSAVHGNGL